tara:strand:- start:5863 stop:6321 length:459 start_codon:yes stop_codon:yes gene_type:complete
MANWLDRIFKRKKRKLPWSKAKDLERGARQKPVIDAFTGEVITPAGGSKSVKDKAKEKRKKQRVKFLTPKRRKLNRIAEKKFKRDYKDLNKEEKKTCRRILKKNKNWRPNNTNNNRPKRREGPKKKGFLAKLREKRRLKKAGPKTPIDPMLY